jgi:Tol biopolymer transport system component
MVSRNILKHVVIATLFILSITTAPSIVQAQYFGQNKVQYDKFDFKVMKTEHFDVYFYPEMETAAKQAARMAERWYARLSRIFNHKLKGRQPLILYASSPEFQQTTALTGLIGEGTGGVTESFKRRIILPLAGSLEATDHVIGHELVHAFQYDMTSQDSPSYQGASPGLARIPLWFIEGLAEYLSIGSIDPHTAMWMRDVTQRRELPTIKKMEDPYKYFPYRYGQSLWAYITGKWGDEAVPSLMKQVSRVGDLEGAVKRVLNVNFETLSKEWQQSLIDAYDPIAQRTQLNEKGSRALLKGSEEARYNVSPALSPDGSKIVFLSSRDLFSIDMYLADARTGKITKKLIKTAVDPHFESLQFIKSSGSWDSQGKRFVFGAIVKGDPALVVVDTENGNREKEIAFENLGEILNPTWSPDGRYIAFSALEGGLTDIFMYDLGSGELKKLTDDPFSDLYPAWSPDGRSIAFVTDRFSSDLSILNIGELQMALLNPETGEMEKIPGFAGAQNINPQWSPDSKALFFLSDQNGIADIYRIDLDSKKITQVTNLYTGVGSWPRVLRSLWLRKPAERRLVSTRTKTTAYILSTLPSFYRAWNPKRKSGIFCLRCFHPERKARAKCSPCSTILCTVFPRRPISRSPITNRSWLLTTSLRHRSLWERTGSEATPEERCPLCSAICSATIPSSPWPRPPAVSKIRPWWSVTRTRETE